MADIDIYQEDSEDPQDDGGDDSGLGCDDFDTCNPDDNLTPIQKLEKYMASENIFSRQMVARSLLETMPAVGEDAEEAGKVLKAMVKLSDDPEPTVRAELMEQVPHLAMYCHENPHLFTDPIPRYLLPTVVRYLTDSHNQVRKTSQAALLVLLEQELVDKADVEEQVCPVILDLSSPFSVDDFRTEAVALMSKMAPLVGKDITQRVFMLRFAELCTDALFHVRKVCAANFGDMCTVVGQENTEKYLLPKFYCLCEDGVWGVRKACAECFMAVACACSIDVRRQDLASLFIALICDQSRWVRMAAFQALGGFISTFADPDVTGIYLNEDGVLIAGNLDDKRDEGPIKFIDEDDDDDDDDSGNEESRQSSSGQSSPDDGPSTSPSTSSTPPEETSPPSPTCTPQVPSDSEASSSAETPASGSSDSTPAEEVPAAGDVDVSDIDMELDQDVVSDSQIDTQVSFKSGDSNDDGAVGDNTTNERLEGDSGSGDSKGEEKSLEEVRAEHYQVEPVGESITEGGASDNSVGSGGDCSNSETNSPNTEKRTGSNPNDSIEPSEENVSKEEQLTEESSTSAEPKVAEQLSSDSPTKADSKSDQQKSVPDSPADSSSPRRLPPSPGVAVEVNEEDYYDFTFWRTPLPEVDLDLDAVKSKSGGKQRVTITPVEVQTDESESGMEVDSLSTQFDGIHLVELGAKASGSHVNTVNESTVEEAVEETVTNIGSTHVLGQHLKESTLTVVNGVVQDANNPGLGYSPKEGSALDTSNDSISSEIHQFQDVIPQALLDHYLSMTDPSRAQNTDTEIARHCAYSLPAVAYTLGRKHWPCLKELYETLAADMQWKVRRTLAFSIHELAVIVGEEITNQDLVPVFNGFLRDLDEVRIGVLKHLGDFLRLLRPEVKRTYLTRIPDFLNTDNTRNWRFREELASQMLLLLDQYDETDISEHIVPIALALCEDKVSEVRHTSYRVLSGVLKRLASGGEEQLATDLMEGLVNRFAKSKQWNKRQIFAQLCHHVLADCSLCPDEFSTHLLPSLISLGHDAIPNVRIALAKTLSQHIVSSEYFTSEANPRQNELLSVITKLKNDADSDVRHFISRLPQTEEDEPITTNEDLGPWGLSAFERTVHFNFGWS